jgi:hypothetical protein
VKKETCRVAHVCSFIPAYQDAPAASTRPVYSSLQSRPQGTLRQESHRPILIVSSSPQVCPLSFPSRRQPTISYINYPQLAVPTYLIEVKYQVQFTHIAKEGIQHLNEEMYSLQVCQLVIVCVNARAEEKAGISTVHDLGHVAELDEVGLVFLVSRRNEAVDLS